MAAKDIEQYQYKPGQSGNPKGRPKNRAELAKVRILGKKEAKQLYGMSVTELRTWEEFLLVATAPQLKLVGKTDETPAYVKGLAIAILSDMNNGKTTTLDKLRDRVFGKVEQRVEVTGKDGEPLVAQREPMTPEQAKELIRKLEEEY